MKNNKLTWLEVRYYRGAFRIEDEPIKGDTNMQDKNKLTWNQVMDKYKQGDTFTAWVDHNPEGRGKRTKLKFIRESDNISSYTNDKWRINGIDFGWRYCWETFYQGLFEIVEENNKTNTNMNYNIPSLLTKYNMKAQALADLLEVTVQSVNNWKKVGKAVPIKYRSKLDALLCELLIEIEETTAEPIKIEEEKINDSELFPSSQSIKVGNVIVKSLLETKPEDWGYLQAFKVAGYKNCTYTIRISHLVNKTYVTAYYNKLESWLADLAYLAPLVQTESFKQHRD